LNRLFITSPHIGIEFDGDHALGLFDELFG